MPDIVHPTPERGTVAGTPKSGQGVCYRFSLSTCSPTFASSPVGRGQVALRRNGGAVGDGSWAPMSAGRRCRGD